MIASPNEPNVLEINEHVIGYPSDVMAWLEMNIKDVVATQPLEENIGILISSLKAFEELGYMNDDCLIDLEYHWSEDYIIHKYIKEEK